MNDNNKNKEFIVILDHNSGEIYISEYDSNLVESYEEYYDILNEKFNLSLKDSECSCMITSELNIKFL